MASHLALLRGINVGGRNKVPMAALRELLESHGHTTVSTYIASEANWSIRKMQVNNPKFKKGDELPTMVVIRADRVTPCKLLNDLIKTCQEYGYRRFSLKAMTKAEGK